MMSYLVLAFGILIGFCLGGMLFSFLIRASKVLSKRNQPNEFLGVLVNHDNVSNEPDLS